MPDDLRPGIMTDLHARFAPPEGGRGGRRTRSRGPPAHAARDRCRGRPERKRRRPSSGGDRSEHHRAVHGAGSAAGGRRNRSRRTLRRTLRDPAHPALPEERVKARRQGLRVAAEAGEPRPGGPAEHPTRALQEGGAQAQAFRGQAEAFSLSPYSFIQEGTGQPRRGRPPQQEPPLTDSEVLEVLEAGEGVDPGVSRRHHVVPTGQCGAPPAAVPGALEQCDGRDPPPPPRPAYSGCPASC